MCDNYTNTRLGDGVVHKTAINVSYLYYTCLRCCCASADNLKHLQLGYTISKLFLVLQTLPQAHSGQHIWLQVEYLYENI